MDEKAKTKKELPLEVQELRARLEEAEEALRAIRSGKVDALVVMTTAGEKVFTLAGADSPYRAMVETMNEGAVTLSPGGTILYCNKRFSDMVKKRMETVIGHRFEIFFAPKTRDALDALLGQEKVENKRIEGSLRARDGTIVPVYFSASPIKGDASKAICVVVTDLTEQKRNEKIVGEAKLAHSILNQSTEAIFVCDKDGRISQVSQVAHRQFTGRLLRQPFDSIIPLSITSPSPSHPTRFTISSVLSGKIIRSLEVTYKREGTTESHFLLSARPLLAEDGKEVIGCVVTLVDITERKRVEVTLRESEKRLRESEEKARNLIAHAPTPIYEVDITGTRFLSVNDTVCELSGYSRDEFRTMSPMDMVDEPSKVSFHDRIKRKLAGEAVDETIEYEVTAKDGRKLTMEVRGISFSYQNGKPESVLVVAHDITERKQAEARLKANLAALTRMHAISGRLLEGSEPQPLLQEIMDAAVAIMGAERGTLQLLEGDSLRIVAQQGHQQPFLDFFAAAENRASVCGEALQRGERVVVLDIETSPLFVGTPSLEVLREAGVRAVQSTPIASRTGKLLGILTTQWSIPHSPDEHDLWRIDLLARQAADLIEYERGAEALRASERRTQEILESISDGFWAVDNNWRFIYLNHRAAQNLGFQPGDLIGKNLWDMFPSVLNTPLEHCYRQGMAGRSPCQFEVDGVLTNRSYSISVYPSGAGISVFWQDITERKQAEEKLLENQALLNAVIESSSDPVYVKDDRSRIIMANQALAKVVGKPLEEILGRTDGEYYCNPDTGQALREHDLRVMKSGQNEVMEETVPTPRGYRTFLSSKTPYRNASGEVIGITGISHDITERKRYEEVLRRGHDELENRVQERTAELSEAIQKLRAENILRERLEKTLRESETQVRFFASQCLTAQETERKRVAGELHDSIAASIAAVRLRIERMAAENQRDLGSTDSLQEIASRVAEINAEVRRIMADLRPSILDDLGIIAAISWFCREYQKTYPQISVEKQIGIEEREVPDSLKTPIFRICQEAMNNSAKHSQGSLVNVSLQKEAERILLTLQDNGQGFDLEKVRKGMGLSTIRERAAFSGGSAEYQSEVGKGTTVRVWWPI